MAQIPSESSDSSFETLSLTVNDPELDFTKAKIQAKDAAINHYPTVMMLSWYDRNTQDCYPRFECGKSDKPPWVVYAEARGANLVVDINQGEYIFMFLKL